jgi:hypothetical protein
MKWNVGKPPAIGWYPSMRIRERTGWNNGWRWWDGSKWSWPAFPHESAERAGKWAAQKESKGHNFEIMWGCK